LLEAVLTVVGVRFVFRMLMWPVNKLRGKPAPAAQEEREEDERKIA
jgi:hypothetical protein